MMPQTSTKFTLNLVLLSPLSRVIITRKQKFLISFQLWYLTSLPTTTLPTEYEANRLTPHFQVLHRFLRQSLLIVIPKVKVTRVGTFFPLKNLKVWVTNKASNLYPSSANKLLYFKSFSTVKVRLVGSSEADGRVEIYYNGAWGRVCGSSWGLQDGRVVCRMFGYLRVLAVGSEKLWKGNGPIWMSNVHCTGTEKSIATCGHRGWGVHDCSSDNEAWVICSNSSGIYERFAQTLSFTFLFD